MTIYSNFFSYIPFWLQQYILSSTANATLFLLSPFKNVNNMKTFVCDYHLNDTTTFLRHQIQVCSAHARIIVYGYKIAFSVLHVHGLMIFQRSARIKYLKRPPDEFINTEMSKIATQRQ